MPQPTADVVICGAGIAGVASAYHLAVRRTLKDVVLIEMGTPLALTSDKSTECYRNWWPGPDNTMISLMNRSIDLLEELAHENGNIFNLSRRGYLFATANPARIQTFTQAAEAAASMGAGPVRYHTGQSGDSAYIPASPQGFADPLTGADIIFDKELIRQHFSYLSDQTVALIHARRCGWFSAQQYGMYLLEQARASGVNLVSGRVEGVETAANRIQAVKVATPSGTETISTPNFVNAAGPFQKQVARMTGVDLPVFCELHVKVAFNDHLKAIPRHAPLVIWTDPVRLPWMAEERAMLAESDETRWLLDEFSAGVHARPEGEGDSTIILILWTYDTTPVEPAFPLAVDPYYPEVALRGLAQMLPALATYFNRAPKPVVDGGYYTKTQENRPLVGPLPVEGTYIIGALSGFGLMVSSAAGELLAAHLTGSELPAYAPAFTLDRYDNPAYHKLLENWSDSGQL